MRRLLVWPIAALGLYLTADVVRRSSGPELTAQFVDVGDVTIRAVADSGGSPPTLVFIHGYSESLFAWRNVFDQFRYTYDVIAIDLPGFGASSKPDAGYTVEDFVRITTGALEQLSREPVVLVGNSMGAQIAATIAIDRPDLVQALILVDAAGLPGPVLSRLGNLGTEAVARVFGVGAVVSPTHDARWLREPDSILAYQPGTDDAYYRALELVLENFDFTSLDGRLTEIRQPTLVVWGRFDSTTPIENGRQFATDIPDAELVIIEGAFHRPHYTHPDAVASLIKDYLSRRFGVTPPTERSR